MNIKKSLWSIVLATLRMILDDGIIENAIEFVFGDRKFRIWKKLLLIIILATWCIIVDNTVIRNAF